MFNFLKKFPFGLDISDFSIEALELKNSFGKTYLRSYGRVKLEEGIVRDGKIKDRKKLKEKINNLLKNTFPKKIRQKKVILSLPESKVFFNFLNLPKDLSKKKLRDAVEKEILKKVPLGEENLYFDFKVVTETEKYQKVLYVASMKQIIDEYLEVAKEIGLKPQVQDIESASLARALEPQIPKDTPTLIADIGARTTILTVVDEGQIQQSAIVPVAGQNFTGAIVNKMGVSEKEAEKLKRTCGIDPGKEGGRIMFILQNLIQEILKETKQIINFYQEKSGREIKKILLSGGSSFMPHLPLDFISNFNIKTEIANPWKGIEVKKKFKKSKKPILTKPDKASKIKDVVEKRLHPGFFTNVIGLAKRGLEDNPETSGINLIPEKKRPKPAFVGRKMANSKTFGVFIILFTTASVGFLSWVIYSYILQPLYLF